MLYWKRKINKSVIIVHINVTGVNDKRQLMHGSVDIYEENDSWKYKCQTIENFDHCEE